MVFKLQIKTESNPKLELVYARHGPLFLILTLCIPAVMIKYDVTFAPH